MSKGKDIIVKAVEDKRMLHFTPDVISVFLNDMILSLEEDMEKIEDMESKKRQQTLIFLWKDIQNILGWAFKHIKIGELKDGKKSNNRS